jgi:hypothetical protein
MKLTHGSQLLLSNERHAKNAPSFSTRRRDGAPVNVLSSCILDL